MSKNKPVLVAVDAGSGNVTLTFEENGQMVTQVTPSLVHEGNTQTFAQESSSTWLTKDASGTEQAFSVVKKGYGLFDTCDPDYQISLAHRVLVTDALNRAGLSGRDVIIADTLPVNQFFSGVGVINEARIQQKIDSLMTPVRNYSSAIEPARILHVEVYPEAVPAVVSAQADYPELESAEAILVVDLGRFTCDIAIVDNELMPVVKKSHEHGVQKMIERVAALLPVFEKENNLNFGANELSIDSIDTFIRQGYVGSRLEIAKDKRIDITSVINQAGAELAATIWKDVRAMHRNTRDVDAVLLVGGGANYIAGKQDKLTNHTADWHDVVIVPDNPEMAIARGVYLALSAIESDILDQLNDVPAPVSSIRGRANDKAV